MEPFKPKATHGPEYGIQDNWITFLQAKGWHVERLVGNAFQKGIPDLYIAHPNDGIRWIDIKVHGNYNFTRAQKTKWPIWERYNIGIWILGATSKADCTKEHMLNEYKLLFKPPNWREFWRDSWDKKPDIDQMIEDLNESTNS